MASGGHLKSSYSNACDFTYDFNCSRCADACSKYVEASYYCQQCDTFFCKPCLVQFACDHNLLGRADLDKWGHSVKLGERCPKHKGHFSVEVYCPKHDVVCCRKCELTSHKMCGSMQNISTIARQKDISSNLKKAHNDLNDLQTKTTLLQQDRTSRIAAFDQQHTELIDDLKAYRSKLNDILDDLEKQTLQEINKMRTDFVDRFKSDQQLCSSIVAELEEFRKKLSRIENNDATLAFVSLNLCDQWTKEQTQLIAGITASTKEVTTSFVPRPHVERTLKRLHALGYLASASKSSVKKVPPSFSVNDRYKRRYVTAINVKFEDDDDVCKVIGMCQLVYGSIVMCDNNNQNLKKMDYSYTIVDVHPLPAYPTAVCTTKDNEVAVALANNTIQFVTVRKRMSTRYTFTIEHACGSLSSSDNKLYAIEQGMSDVFEYDLSGSLLRTIPGNSELVGTRSLAASPNGENLYITDRQSGLVTLDMDGNLLAVFKPDDQDGVEGVCVDGLGNVFVCGISPTHILQVSQDGNRQIAKFAFESDERNVLALCFDKLHMRLLVAKNRCDLVYVIQLKKVQ